MIEPSRHLAELTAKTGQAEGLREKVPGATHGSEIPYVFDAVTVVLKDKATKADVAMGKTTSGY